MKTPKIIWIASLLKKIQAKQLKEEIHHKEKLQAPAVLQMITCRINIAFNIDNANKKNKIYWSACGIPHCLYPFHGPYSCGGPVNQLHCAENKVRDNIIRTGLIMSTER